MLHMLPTVRLALYGFLLFTAFFTFVMSAATIGNTESNYGFYINATAETLAASLLALGTLAPLLFIHLRKIPTVLNQLVIEMGILVFLWLMFLGGAAALANDTTICFGLTFCHLTRAIEAFAWLFWIADSVLLALLAFSGFKGGSAAWTRPFAVGGETQPTSATPMSGGAPVPMQNKSEAPILHTV